MTNKDGSAIRAIIDYWHAAGEKVWFAKSAEIDREIRELFGGYHDQACDGALDHWAETASGSLALLILLDQFSRNLYRGSDRAFAHDEKARAIARGAIENGFDEAISRDVDPVLRSFFFLPFMHSEQLQDQDFCLECYRRIGDENGVKYAIIHRDIIERFGRFPHRNNALDRGTTAAEQAFLDGGGFKG